MSNLEKQMSLNKTNFNCYHVIQPIFELKQNKIIGYEFLLRSEQNHNPELLFKMAKSTDQLNRLDKYSIETIFQVVSERESDLTELYLFVNVFPSTILSTDMKGFLHKILLKTNLSHKQIVFEINESEGEINLPVFKNAIGQLRKNGFLVALDDVGKGYSNIKTILEIDPDFVKLDKYFSEGLSRTPKKQKFLKSMIQLLNSSVILEGLETEEDLVTAKENGVTHAQGYFLGKPASLNTYVKKKEVISNDCRNKLRQTKKEYRWNLLKQQFDLDPSNVMYKELKESLNRILHYVYTYTNVMFIDFVDEKVLYGYVKYHISINFSIVDFKQVLKDIKHFIFFLKNVKKREVVPKVDFSTNNIRLWLRF